jgi:hypothetical protein
MTMLTECQAEQWAGTYQQAGGVGRKNTLVMTSATPDGDNAVLSKR